MVANQLLQSVKRFSILLVHGLSLLLVEGKPLLVKLCLLGHFL